MKAILVRHTHPDIPAWAIVEDSVPLGTTYEVLGFQQRMLLKNPMFGEVVVDCHFVYRTDGGPPGYLPDFCLKIEES